MNFGIGEKHRQLYPITVALMLLFSMLMLIWSQFYPYIIQLYSLESVSAVAVSASILGAGTLLTLVLSGYLADKFGPKIPLAISGALIFLGMFLISQMFSFDQWSSASLYWYSGSFIVGLGSGFLIGAFPVVLGRWFPDAPGRAFGIALFGQNVSPIVLAPISAYLISLVGLPGTFIGLGVIVFAAIYLIGVLLWKVPDADWAPEGFKVLKVSEESFSLKQAISDARFWILFTAMLSTAIGWFLILLNVATIVFEGLVERASLSYEYVVGFYIPLFMSITALGNGFGALFWGTLNDRIGTLKTLPVLYTICGISIMLLYASYTNPLLLILFGVLLYFTLGGEPAVHFSAVPTFFGRKFVARITSVLNTSVMTAAVIGPYLGAAIRDLTDSYFYSLLIAAILHFFAALVVYFGRRYAGGGKDV